MSARRNAAIVVITAFLFALAAAASPQLHERLHAENIGAEHVCAVTLLASGNCEHAAPAPLCARPAFIEQTTITPGAILALARTLEFSLLEHAPPAVS
ncbi:MAG: hypothetical protein ACJ8KU_05540 [Chthoniobacterales bacterium]